MYPQNKFIICCLQTHLSFIEVKVPFEICTNCLYNCMAVHVIPQENSLEAHQEVSCYGASHEYLQHMLLWRKKKDINIQTTLCIPTLDTMTKICYNDKLNVMKPWLER